MSNNMGDKIKMLRVANNLSQEEIALRLSVSQPTYSRIEQGKYSRLPVALIEKLAGILETTPETLMSFQDGLSHLPEYLREFVKDPRSTSYVENAFLDMKMDLRRSKNESRIV